jgi:hypothetical protein
VLPVGAALEAVMIELERDRWSMKVRAGDRVVEMRSS